MFIVIKCWNLCKYLVLTPRPTSTFFLSSASLILSRVYAWIHGGMFVHMCSHTPWVLITLFVTLGLYQPRDHQVGYAGLPVSPSDLSACTSSALVLQELSTILSYIFMGSEAWTQAPMPAWQSLYWAVSPAHIPLSYSFTKIII